MALPLTSYCHYLKIINDELGHVKYKKEFLTALLVKPLHCLVVHWYEHPCVRFNTSYCHYLKIINDELAHVKYKLVIIIGLA